MNIFKSKSHMHARRTSSAAFTLLELLVVVAIIGVITAVIMMVTSTSRIKGRDSHRVSEIRQIRYALEQYRLVNGQYPTCLYPGGACTTVLNGSAQMRIVPRDPLTGAPYAYAGLSTSVGGPTCSSYHLGATLEDKNNTSLRTGSDAPATLNICAGSAADFEGLAFSSTVSAQCTGATGTPQPTAAANGETCYDRIPD